MPQPPRFFGTSVEAAVMAKFAFIVRSQDGRVRKGNVSEVDEEAARKRLMKAGFEVISLSEKTDLIVHEETRKRGRPTPQRAAIIDFEETPLERFWGFVQSRLLRRETALVLAVIGFVWLIVGSLGGPKETAPPEPEFKLYKISVQYDPADYRYDLVTLRLPEIPVTLSAKVEKGATSANFELEAVQTPSQVEVKLLDGGKPVAEDAGSLVSSAAKGEYSYQAELKRVKD